MIVNYNPLDDKDYLLKEIKEFMPDAEYEEEHQQFTVKIGDASDITFIMDELIDRDEQKFLSFNVIDRSKVRGIFSSLHEKLGFTIFRVQTYEDKTEYRIYFPELPIISENPS